MLADCFDGSSRVGHGVAFPADLEHADVVIVIAEAHTFFRLHSEPVENDTHPGTFVDSLIHDINPVIPAEIRIQMVGKTRQYRRDILRGTLMVEDSDLANDGTETVFVGFDTIRELEYVKIYNKDMTGVVKNDNKVAELIKKAAEMNGIDAPIGTIELGSTDAAAMSQGGFRASTMVAMDPTPARYYHTRLDADDNLSLGAIEAGVKVAIETVFLFDEQGA